VDALEGAVELPRLGEIVTDEVDEAVVEEEQEEVGPLDAACADDVHRPVAQGEEVVQALDAPAQVAH